jgi:putative hydrolase of the HAD superfamily
VRRCWAALFDAAGTLIELREPVGETYARIAREHGVDLAPERVEASFRIAFARAPAMAFPGAPAATISRLEKDWWRGVVSNTFRSADPRAAFCDFENFFDRLFDAMGQPDAWREVPGARSLLVALRSLGWVTAIVSNFDRRLPGILEGLGLAELLDAIVLCSDVGAAKPEPAIFRHALQRLGVPAASAIFVGDDEESDIAGARAAGIRAIHLKSPATLDDLLNRLTALALSTDAQRRGSKHGG